ncbi:MAG: pseudouridine synthase [SAR324 cluster bacterium]|nr:pseudouridine synthase [SAR324 cluster bacterium]
MKERLQKILAQAGVASRRGSEEFITRGMVEVNGEMVTELGAKADPEVDDIRVGGKKLRLNQEKVVYALYKPKSVVTTLKDPEGRKTVADYIPHTKDRLFPVGRLDYDAEGLILLTNDGDLAQELMHPSGHVWKEYLVKVKGNITNEVMAKLARGPVLDGKKKKPCKIKLIHYKGDKSWLSVSLQEGIKHQIKRMFLYEGHPVSKIKRIKIGNIIAGDLETGQSRLLTLEEVQGLRDLIAEKKPKKAPKKK